ncbi:hypothetical protein AQJ46_43600 [Streptomyces canus]|uniref:Uncharacterized protein n=1 Tax=Streptomyces canus TaxID=58343 RepID=A0A101RMU1_9ACTN|nr:hypothetical protein AQJ46_43600 [Streptomyces canus]
MTAVQQDDVRGLAFSARLSAYSTGRYWSSLPQNTRGGLVTFAGPGSHSAPVWIPERTRRRMLSFIVASSRLTASSA